MQTEKKDDDRRGESIAMLLGKRDRRWRMLQKNEATEKRR